MGNSRHRIFSSLALLALAVPLAPPAWAADPGEAWFTEGTGSGVPPQDVQWLAPGSVCPVPQEKLAETVQALASKSSLSLTLKTLLSYAGPSCKGKYGQRPYLVRAVSAAGDGRLDAGLLRGEVWMRYAGLGGRHPFEKTPVVLWLYAPPSRVHISVGIVE